MRIAGVATVADRQEFFEEKVSPSLMEGCGQVEIYRDYPCPILGDAGKFRGFQMATQEDFYYFSCDDDLIYSPTYFDLLEEWIQKYDNKVVCSLHGSSFREFPIETYYGDKYGTHCLYPNEAARRTILPGTGAMAFHSSLFTPEERKNFLDSFPVPNMADIWMGIILQMKEIPAIVVPHDGDLLTYNPDLPLKDTIWGQSHQDDFVQTAVVNEWSRSPGWKFPRLPQAQSPERRESPRSQS